VKVAPRVWVTALLVAACGCLWAEGASGPQSPSRPPHDPGKDTKKPPQYIVVEVGNTAGEVRYEAIPDGDLGARKKECAATHREVLADWKKAMDEARKNKEKFTEKKPVAPYVKKVGGFFTSEDEARAEAEKLRNRLQPPKAEDASPPADPKKGVEGKGEAPAKNPNP